VGLFPHAPHGPPAAHTTAPTTATAATTAAAAAPAGDLLGLLGRGRAARGLADTTDGAKLRALQVAPPRSPTALSPSRAFPYDLSPLVCRIALQFALICSSTVNPSPSPLLSSAQDAAGYTKPPLRRVARFAAARWHGKGKASALAGRPRGDSRARALSEDATEEGLGPGGAGQWRGSFSGPAGAAGAAGAGYGVVVATAGPSASEQASSFGNKVGTAGRGGTSRPFRGPSLAPVCPLSSPCLSPI